MTHDIHEQPDINDRADPALEALPSPYLDGKLLLHFRLWYRQTMKRWSAIGGIFDSWKEGDNYAKRDPSRQDREYVILPRDLVPHPGFSVS